jgi:hypothetical protein
MEIKDAGAKAMALVDGQLAPAEVPDLVQELARNAPLVAELQEYLAMSRGRIAAAYTARSDEPVPAWLVDTVMRQPVPAPAPMRPRHFGRGLLQGLQRRLQVPVWSLATAPALAVLVAVLWLGSMSQDPGRSGIAVAGLGAALERTESGKDAALATLRPVLTFNSKAAGWCRQFDVRYGNSQVSHGLACRGEDGQWSVVSATAPGTTGLMPAGSNRRKVIDDLVTSMMRGNPLSQVDEATAIGGAWRRP